MSADSPAPDAAMRHDASVSPRNAVLSPRRDAAAFCRRLPPAAAIFDEHAHDAAAARHAAPPSIVLAPRVTSPTIYAVFACARAVPR